MPRPADHLQRFYWIRFQEANQYMLHDNVPAGTDVCLELLLNPDLSIFLRALINSTLALHSDIRRYPDKMRFVDECFAQIKQLEEDAKPGDEQLIWLKNTAAETKGHVEKQMKAAGIEPKQDTEKEHESQDDDTSEIFQDAQERLEAFSINSPGEVREPSLPPMPKEQKNGAAYPTPEPTSEAGPRNGNGNGNGNGDVRMQG